MNCSDWEREIAGESESAGLSEHLQGCGRCQEFARELDANRVALRELTVHPAAFVAVRRRVLDEIQAKRRRAFWWGWPAAAAAAAAILCLVYLAPRVQNPVAPKVAWIAVQAPVVVHQAPPVQEVVRHRGVHRRPDVGMSADAARKSACATCQPLMVKMLTSDPDVIIIWLVDQKGDSL
jgi:hypothetical protein